MRPWLPVLLLLMPGAAHAAAACAWAAPGTVLEDSPGLVVTRWDVPDDPGLQQELAATAAFPALERYRAWGRRRAGDVDAFALLRRQADYYHCANPRDEPRIRLILRRAAGSVRPMSCLEGLLFEDHSARFPVEGYNEFLALALRKSGRLRVYSLSSGLGNGSATGADHIAALIEADRADGWTLAMNLHNHPFAPDDPSYRDVGGTTVPSGNASSGDLHIFSDEIQRWGLDEAAITNGYDTVHMSPSDVSRLIMVTEAASGAPRDPACPPQ